MWLVSRRLGVASTLASVVMAFSRVYIAAHFPHDVLAGLLLGAAVSIVGYLLARGVLTRLITVLETSVAGPLLTCAPTVHDRPAVNHSMVR